MPTLWLCIDCPQLPLDALPLAPPEQAHAVLDNRQHLLCVNQVAQGRGLRAGIPRGTAQAIAPELHCHQRQPRAEEALLQALASWALQFTSRVCVSSTLQLEIGGSLKLFGSLERLLEQVRSRLPRVLTAYRLGIAPTPLAAEVLARAEAAPIFSSDTLAANLRPLPLTLMAWESKITQAIQAVGARTIGDCLDLPRSGFNERYGTFVSQQLDQLLGIRADPRPCFQPPQRYRRILDTLQDTRDTASLFPGFEQLFQQLELVLQARDQGVTRLQLRFHHARLPPTTLELGLQSPGRSAKRWMQLLEEHCHRLQLPADVRSIELRADQFISLGRTQTQLWQQADPQEEKFLLERLAARLGPSALYGLSSCQTHTPEQAWKAEAIGQGTDEAAESRPRPLWLLPEPRPVEFSQLRLLSGAERLETRWWGEDCCRDYYRARDTQGRVLWVYRAHADQRWYVHGLFA